jgi:ADP-ribosyl-[dinitrogen reductase] hydrolase
MAVHADLSIRRLICLDAPCAQGPCDVLFCIDRASSFQEAILLAVNLGDDADTTGAVCGQLAGAFYGSKGLPEKWCALLCQPERLMYYSEVLFDSAPA